MIVKCRSCKEEFDVPITPQQLGAWQSGKYIQDAAPNLCADDRELLISNTCGTCFDRMFPPED